MVVYSDELCHWAKGSVGKNHKYIKREWKNGRWRYYYSGAKLPSLGLNARKKLKDYEKTARAELDFGTDAFGTRISTESYGFPDDPYAEMRQRQNEMHQYASKSSKLARQAEKAKSAYDKAEFEYEANRYAELAANSTEKWNRQVEWVSKHKELQSKYNATFLGKAENSIQKGKTFVQSLFKR